MRYLKRFNESDEKFKDLKDFCETHLAYLLDDEDFKLFVDDIDSNYSRYSSSQVDTTTKEGQIRIENGEGFKWDDIKDHFIPFLIQLDKIRGSQIKIGGEKSLFIHSNSGNWYKISFDDLINDFKIKDSLPALWDKIHIELIIFGQK